MYSLFQLDTSVAATPLPHNVCILLTFSPGKFSPLPCLEKNQTTSPDPALVHTSQKSPSTSFELSRSEDLELTI